jgi:hypothetical protein
MGGDLSRPDAALSRFEPSTLRLRRARLWQKCTNTQICDAGPDWAVYTVEPTFSRHNFSACCLACADRLCG